MGRHPKITAQYRKCPPQPAARDAETITENLFRVFYGADTFIEKSAIPATYGFISKKGTGNAGYPDFFYDDDDYAIVVEAKALDHDLAEQETKFYLTHNKATKDLLGIAVSGQTKRALRVTYFYRAYGTTDITTLDGLTSLILLDKLRKVVRKATHGAALSDDQLRAVLKGLNNRFNARSTVRDTDRSMFFSGLMIALKDDTFRRGYRTIQAPTPDEVQASRPAVLIEPANLNTAIVAAINRQLTGKVNNRSKKIDWQDRFSFIKTIDYPLDEYKEIIYTIEEQIFVPYQNEENQDILGKAYKIFLSRAGKMDNKNIILTPDHVKSFMVKLARLGPDDVVLDTCTGTGGFLMEAMEVLCKMAGGNEAKLSYIKDHQLIGFENDVVLFSLACSNMFLHGDGRSTLLYRSSLLSENRPEDVELFAYIRDQKPTKCVINPPYENNFPIEFTQQALRYLEPGGKLIIIMPETTLVKHPTLTKDVLETAKLDFVVRMPERLFSEQGRAVNAAVFGFTNTPHDPDDTVLFYDLSDDGFESVQHKGRVDVENRWAALEANAVSAIRNQREIPGVSQKRPIFNNGVLRAAGYFPKGDDTAYERVPIGDLFDIVEGTLPSGSSVEDGEHTFITASSEWKRHTTYTHDRKALVFAVGAGGSLGRTHYVSGKFVASNLCLVLTAKARSKRPVDLAFYNHYFQTIQQQLVADLASGASKKTIAKSRLAAYEIDYIPLDTQREFVKSHARKLSVARSKLQEQESALTTRMSEIIMGPVVTTGEE